MQEDSRVCHYHALVCMTSLSMVATTQFAPTTVWVDVITNEGDAGLPLSDGLANVSYIRIKFFYQFVFLCQ